MGAARAAGPIGAAGAVRTARRLCRLRRCLACAARLIAKRTAFIGAKRTIGTTGGCRRLRRGGATGSVGTARAVRAAGCLYGYLGRDELRRCHWVAGKRVRQCRPGQNESDHENGRRKEGLVHRDSPMLKVLNRSRTKKLRKGRVKRLADGEVHPRLLSTTRRNPRPGDPASADERSGRIGSTTPARMGNDS